MKRTDAQSLVAAALGMVILILDGKTALMGAQSGIELCIRTVIPSLFPFFLLSHILTGRILGHSVPMLAPIRTIAKIPIGGESVFLTGILGGYPVGVQAACTGGLQQTDAARMIAFCNNAGPSFIFGVAASLFPYRWIPWALWGIQIVSALMVAYTIPPTDTRKITPIKENPPTVTASMTASLKNMGSVCGWVIIFRILINVLNRWVLWFLPEYLQILIAGILELTNGCCQLGDVSNIGLRFVICAGFLSFGGLCVAMQAASAAKDNSFRLYFPGKILQTLFSILLAILIQNLLPIGEKMAIDLSLHAIVLMILLLIPVKKQIDSSIPAKVRV